MVVQLAFIFSLAIHLRHVFEGVEHALNDLLISSIDVGSYLKTVGTDELIFDLTDIDREIFDKVSYALALFAS